MVVPKRGWSALSALALLSVSCGGAETAPEVAPDDFPPEVVARMDWPDPLEGWPRGDEQRQRLCARPGDDLLRDMFCAEQPPDIGGLEELQQALRVSDEHIGGLRGLSVTAHSTAVASRSVSAINPRVVSFQLQQLPQPMSANMPEPALDYELVGVGFVRGEQAVEMVTRDRQDGEMRFYLLRYRQPCNDSDRGCMPGDLLTPDTERGWTELSLYDEEDLKNTIIDCRQCHQPDGPGTPKMLRMQELQAPWTHWLFRSTDGGRALLSDYRAAHGDETYGGMSARSIEESNPGSLELFLAFSNPFVGQPNEFNGKEIEKEIEAEVAALGGDEDAATVERPADWILQQSPTWRVAYERARQGEAIPVPYPAVRVTDPDRLAAMTAAYAAYREGSLSREELPDIRDVFPDDPYERAAMGFGPEPGLDAQALLVQACGQCHNDRLDQSLGRARFNVDLDQLPRDVKEAAIERLRLPATDIRAMPPVQVRSLDAAARAALVELLQR